MDGTIKIQKIIKFYFCKPSASAKEICTYFEDVFYMMHSPYLSQPDFSLFLELKDLLRGIYFKSLEDIKFVMNYWRKGTNMS